MFSKFSLYKLVRFSSMKSDKQNIRRSRLSWRIRCYNSLVIIPNVILVTLYCIYFVEST